MPLYANAGSWSKHAACCARSADSLPLAPCRGGTAENETDIEHQPRIANRRATWEPMVPGQLVPAYGWRVLRVSKEFQTTASGALPANPPTRGNHNSTPHHRTRQAEELLVRAGRLRPTSEPVAGSLPWSLGVG